MFRLFKIVVFLVVLAGVVVVGYAYLGNLSPERHDVTEPVDLNAS